MLRPHRRLAVGLLACAALLLAARFLTRAPDEKYGTVIAIVIAS